MSALWAGLVGRGAGVQVPDAPQVLAPRQRGRFEPLSFVGIEVPLALEEGDAQMAPSLPALPVRPAERPLPPPRVTTGDRPQASVPGTPLPPVALDVDMPTDIPEVQVQLAESVRHVDVQSVHGARSEPEAAAQAIEQHVAQFSMPHVEIERPLAAAQQQLVQKSPDITISIGRVEIELPAPPPPPVRAEASRTTGFDQYARARRGQRR